MIKRFVRVVASLFILMTRMISMEKESLQAGVVIVEPGYMEVLIMKQGCIVIGRYQSSLKS
jgi:hypothetical protein